MLDRVRGIFDVNNSFYSFGRKLLYVFLLNIVFAVTCLPVITAGASMTAMNSVFMKIINERDFSIFKDYFKAFKENFAKSTAIWLLGLTVGAIVYLDIVYWAVYGLDDGAYAYVMLVFSCIAGVFLLMMLHTAFPLISRFEMNLKELITNIFRITVRDIFYCLEAVIFTVLIVGVTIYMIMTGKLLFMIYMVFLCFGLNGLIQAYIYRRVLNKYSEEYIEMVKRVQKEMEEENRYY